MDFRFSEREKLLRKSIAEFAQREIAPLVDKMEEEGGFDPQLIPKLAQIGILGLITPPEYGGNGMGHVAKVVLGKHVLKNF